MSRIAVFGLGYVGSVSAACFAERGNEVIGVDVNADKVDLINEGRTPVLEERIGDVIADGIESGRLRATTDVTAAVEETDIALICVGTPSAPSGGLSTEYLERVVEQIGEALADREERYTVVLRSTMVPGTCEELLIPLLEKHSGKTAGTDFGIAVNPEFLREGTSVQDFFDPPKTVIGEYDPETGDVVASLYDGLPGPVFRTAIKVAEMTKYVDNSFHALKVAFANEVGTVSKALGLDSHQVMDIFKADTKLNIAPTYLTPGYAFGGSCLPKDVRGLLHTARHRDLSLPLWEAILPSNEAIIDRVFEMIQESGAQRVSLFGLSFKAGTDDLRESPMVELAERLLGRGHDLLIHDQQVAVSNLQGANRAYVEARIPHLSRLMATSADAVANHAEIVVLASKDPDAIDAISRATIRPVIDLVRSADEELASREGYSGVAW